MKRNKNSNFSINSSTLSSILQCKFKKCILKIQRLVLPKFVSKDTDLHPESQNFVGFEPKWPPMLFPLDCSFDNSASGKSAACHRGNIFSNNQRQFGLAEIFLPPGKELDL